MEAFYSKPMNEAQQSLASTTRVMFANIAMFIQEEFPEGRYKSIVMTKLEEAAMFATKAITHEWKE